MLYIKKVFTLIAVLVVLTCLFYVGLNKLASKESRPFNNRVTQKKTTPKKLTPPKVRLVALGDSLTQGVGDTTQNGGYVYLIKQVLERRLNATVTTKNYGKAGDRSDQIRERLLQQEQMQQDLKKANVITMTVGGNDLMQTLQKNFNSVSSDQLTTFMPTAQKTYTQKLTALLKTVRSYNSDAPIFLYTVYNPFYVYFPALTQMQKYTAQWNTLVSQTVAKDKKIYMVNVERRLSEGQYYDHGSKLKQTTVTDYNNLSGEKLTQVLNNQKEKNNYLSATDHFHPNLKGYKYMAAKLYQVMLKHKETWLKSGG
ncbi:SGNH/GDSL hydrolase family protein [Liquorilactobacillus capillatus]|uniref:Lipase acylhydrolase n=1 Tax=Liquorilactobacillus capillatus DSM 19910 TaxID=1423731 RepID=A0A0R1LZV4_9LACO|nr:SGNH/GDSL hydrolase family protein [Liquorilactobacillus capillatus]KRL01215.1 lipase acylhydrolase [Liquorilactobacillus capillatus DSM 19910]